MGLSEDSRTLLQLLLGRGKSYSDIAGLLGIDETEVRSRAHQALTEINGSDPDSEVNLTDYLLGQSDPIGRAEVARALAENEEAADTASSLADQLSLLVPGADLPRNVGGKATTARGTSKAAPRRNKPQGKGSRSTSPNASGDESDSNGGLGSQKRLIAILVLAAFLVAVVILLLTGVFGGSDDKEETPAPSAANAGAVMQPVGNQGGSGRVQFGRVEDNFAANLQFSELDPTGEQNSYVLWMDGSIGAFPLNELEVGDSGTYGNTIVLPPEALCSITAGIFTDLSLSRVSKEEADAIVQQTSQALEGNQSRLPALAGKPVFEGPIALPQSLRQAINRQCQGTQTGVGATGP